MTKCAKVVGYNVKSLDHGQTMRSRTAVQNIGEAGY